MLNMFSVYIAAAFFIKTVLKNQICALTFHTLNILIIIMSNIFTVVKKTFGQICSVLIKIIGNSYETLLNRLSNAKFSLKFKYVS